MLPEEKIIIERMMAEGKIDEEEADSLIQVLEGRDNQLVQKNIQVERTKGKTTNNMSSTEDKLLSLGNIIKNFFQNGDTFVPGDKYKVIRNFSGAFPGNSIPQISIFSNNGNVSIREQEGAGYKLELELMVKAKEREEAERKVDETSFVKLVGEKLEIDCRDFQGAKVNLYLSRAQLYRLKSEIHNGAYYIEKNRYEEFEVVTKNGMITVKDVDAGTAKIKSNNGKIDFRGCGDLDVSTNNGMIDIELQEKEGIKTSVNLSTYNGKCTVKLPAKKVAYLDCKTKNGRVNLAIDNLNFTKNKKAGPSQHIIAEKMGGDKEKGIYCQVETKNGVIDIIGV